MKTKTFLVNLGILLLSFSAAAQTPCPDEKGDCFLRDLWVGEAPADLSHSHGAAFSCPENQFATGLTMASSVQEFGRDVTSIIGSSFGIPTRETNWEVRYIRPVNWITQLHCGPEKIDIDLPEVFVDNDPVHRKTFATTDIRCDDGKVISGLTILSQHPESEEGKSLRSYLKGVRLTCTDKESGEKSVTNILGFDMAESFCKTEFTNPFMAGNATGIYTTVCSSVFNEWDWENTDRFENLEMEFAPDRAFGFFTRRKWLELPNEGTQEENCTNENGALSEITLHYNGDQNNLIGIGQNCREFRQNAATEKTSPETAAKVAPTPRRTPRKPDATAIARKKEKMRGKPKKIKNRDNVEKKSPVEANRTPAPENRPAENPRIKEEEKPEFIPFDRNNGGSTDSENPSKVAVQSSDGGGGSWYSCALRPKNAEADSSGLPLLLLVGFWLLWSQKKGKEV